MIVSKRLIAVIVGALAVGLIAGCGGGGSSGSGGEVSTSSLSRTAFVKQATAICTKQREQIEAKLRAFLKENGGLPGASGSGDGPPPGTVVLPAYKAEIEEFRALGAPSGSEDEIEAILAAFERGIEEAEKRAAKGEIRTPSGIYKANELAKEFGLKICMTAL
jgi:hypothetical protein